MLDDINYNLILRLEAVVVSKKKKTFWQEVKSFSFAILIALTIRWAFFEAYVIPSGSMLPTLLIHDHIFVNKFIYGIRFPFSKSWLAEFKKPTRGDIIVFKYPEDESIFFIKRIVGVPGDKISYDGTKLIINDKLIENQSATDKWDYNFVRDKDLGASKEDFMHLEEKLTDQKHSILLYKSEFHKGTDGVITIPPANYFVMGDNRDNSKDSRFWGFVPAENILGRASIIWLSCDETLPVVNFLCNPLTLRWKRFFHLTE